MAGFPNILALKNIFVSIAQIDMEIDPDDLGIRMLLQKRNPLYPFLKNKSAHQHKQESILWAYQIKDIPSAPG